MPFFSIAEQAIEKSTDTQEPDVSFVQRSERTARELDLARVGHTPGLQGGRGHRQKIFNVIQRQAPVFEPRGRAGRDGEDSLRNIPKNRNLVVAPGEIAQLQVGLLHPVVGQTVSLLPRSANPEEYDLLIEDALGRRQAIDRLVAEVRRQHPPAVIDAIKRDHHYQHTARFQPPEEVLQENGFHPLVPALSDLEVVGWVQVQEGERFNGRMAIESAALDNFIGDIFRLSRAVRVEFNRVPPDAIAGRDRSQRRACSGTWIQHRCCRG